MEGFCDRIQAIIGPNLEDISANRLSEATVDEESVCFYSVQDRIVAISYSLREFVGCNISPPNITDFTVYREWPSLWTCIGLDKNTDTPDGLRDYLALFPTRFDDFVEFIGKCLIKYFL